MYPYGPPHIGGYSTLHIHETKRCKIFVFFPKPKINLQGKFSE